MSEIEWISKPSAFNALTADSRPGPGPLILTSSCLTPISWARLPQVSAAVWAANGVLFLDPLNPELPADAQHNVSPCRSEIVIIVLLKVACTCATPSVTFFLTLAFPLLLEVLGLAIIIYSFLIGNLVTLLIAVIS